MQKALRIRKMVDPKLQGALLFRTLLYWVACVGVVLVLAALQVVWSGRDVEGSVLIGRAVMAFGPALIASFVVLPFIAFDALRFSNRFAGPMHRLRQQASRLAAGETVGPVTFREGDYWNELATSFNQIAAELAELREQSSREAPPESEARSLETSQFAS